MGKINDGVIAERRRLSDLLREEYPSAETRKGTKYAFDRVSLHEVHDRLPESLQVRLRIPIIFFFDSLVADSCLLTDPIALDALQKLGELSGQRQMIEGRLWVGRAIVYALMVKYPTLIQIIMR